MAELLIPRTGGDAPALVSENEGQLVTTTLAIAEGTEVEHASVIKLVRTYLTDLEEFGGVRFEIRPFQTAGGLQHREVAVLNEEHATLLLTYMRNSEVVRAFKKRLVKAFWAMKRSAPADAQPLVPQTLPEALRLAADLAERAAVLEAENRAQAQQLVQAAPKVALAEAITEADGAQDLAATAQMFRTGRTRMIQILREQGVFKRGEPLPYQRYCDLKYFRVVEVPWRDSEGRTHLRPKALVTGRGLEFIRRCLDNSGGQPPLLS